MDATLFRSLVVSFVVCFVALAAIFNIFTLFELWRFNAVTHRSGGKVSVIPPAAHYGGAFSCDDADHSAGHLRFAREET